MLLKPTGGGGGIGMIICNNEKEVRIAFQEVKQKGETYFKHSGLFVEKYIRFAKHIEVQIFGDCGTFG